MKKEFTLPTVFSIVLTTSLMLYIYHISWVGQLMPRIAIVIGAGLVAVGSAMVGIGFSKLACYWANMEESENE